MHRLGHRAAACGAVGLAVVASLVGMTTATASAEDPIGGIVAGILGGSSASPSSASSAPGASGSLSMPSGRLRKGCRDYAYTYSVTVPADSEWDLEIFVTDRRGTAQASDVILSGADPLSGTKRIPLCRYNTVPGTFTMRGTLYTSDGANPTGTTVLPADRFKLTIHHRHKKRHR